MNSYSKVIDLICHLHPGAICTEKKSTRERAMFNCKEHLSNGGVAGGQTFGQSLSDQPRGDFSLSRLVLQGYCNFSELGEELDWPCETADS